MPWGLGGERVALEDAARRSSKGVAGSIHSYGVDTTTYRNESSATVMADDALLLLFDCVASY
jgi:hypothetical protein